MRRKKRTGTQISATMPAQPVEMAPKRRRPRICSRKFLRRTAPNCCHLDLRVILRHVLGVQQSGVWLSMLMMVTTPATGCRE